MTIAVDILDQLREMGASVAIENGSLIIEANGDLPEPLIEQIRGAKPALLAILSEDSDWAQLRADSARDWRAIAADEVKEIAAAPFPKEWSDYPLILPDGRQFYRFRPRGPADVDRAEAAIESARAHGAAIGVDGASLLITTPPGGIPGLTLYDLWQTASACIAVIRHKPGRAA